MSATFWNRVTTALAWAGCFVAGVLAYSHLTATTPPCGPGNKGCAQVASDPSSEWAGIPVAVFGLAAYLLLAGIALAREKVRGATYGKLVNLGTIVSGAGFAISLMLVYTSVAVIKATCVWCLGSALAMTLLFVAHILLRSKPEPADRPAGLGAFLPTALGAVAALGLMGATVPQLKGSAQNFDLGKYTESDLIPAESRIIGPPDAPITVVELADVNCPACRSSFLDVKVIINNGRGKIRMGFRHFPLYTKEGHETSLQAAVIAQYAARKGRFWPFMEQMFDPKNNERVKSVEGLLAIAAESGVDSAGARQALDPESPESKEVIDDFTIIQELGIQLTPSFLVFAPGTTPKIANPTQLAVLLAQSPYREIIQGK